MQASGPTGLLIIDKPAGWTSHDVVARLRRITGQPRIGHAGTLDPAATGVLPVALGRATRLLEYLSDASKAYRAVVCLGIATDTADATGSITRQCPWDHITEDAVRTVLGGFMGEIQQRPPAYSAIKHHGVPLHRLARAGRTVEVAPRAVRIDRLELVDFAPPVFTVEVECSKGTYIRSLAADTGDALGCGAHLAALVRTRSGPFTLADAISVDDVAQAAEAGHLVDLLMPPDALARELPAVAFDAAAAYRLLTGRHALSPAAPAEPVPARAYGHALQFLGIVRAHEGAWQPVKMLLTPDQVPVSDEP